MRTYLENGSSIRPDWTDRIAVSFIPDLGDKPQPAAIVVAAVAGASDITPDSYTLIPATFVKNYWLLYDDDGTLSTNNQYLYTFSASQAGDYKAKIDYDSATGDNSYYFWQGRYGTNLALYQEWGTTTPIQRGNFYASATIDTTAIADYSHSGWLEYVSNQWLVNAGTTQVVALNEYVTVAFDNTNFPALTYGEHRVYVPEIGCYFGGDNATTQIWETYDNLHCDYSIKKSDIQQVEKQTIVGKTFGDVEVPPKYCVIITMKNGNSHEFEMGTVANKPTWTENVAGLNIAYNEIQSWIV
jgi:hypothetical protein